MAKNVERRAPLPGYTEGALQARMKKWDKKPYKGRYTMDHTVLVSTTIAYIEGHIRTGVDFTALQRQTGFSYRAIRRIFGAVAGVPLSRYIMARRVAYAAGRVSGSAQSLTAIAYDFGFESYDTFTRAFRRITGQTPSAFRKAGVACGRRRICMGVFGPALPAPVGHGAPASLLMEENNMDKMIKNTGSCVLYGVPKVYYNRNFECTPFPMCLQAVLEYMGQQVPYAYLMAASGAAFRLRWSTAGWDLGQVDIRNTYANPRLAFAKAFEAAGRSFTMLEREAADEAAMTRLVCAELNAGRPVIALGVIGPPEACIITGYRENGKTLLGWNLFQENMEFAQGLETEPSGYFVKKGWWENTKCVMAVGGQHCPQTQLADILKNALALMRETTLTTREGTVYHTGQAGYTAWAAALRSDPGFAPGALLPALAERLMCQGDAEVMVGEGRSFAAGWMEWVAAQLPAAAAECMACAKALKAVGGCVHKMGLLRGNTMQNAENVQKFAEKEVREKTAQLVLAAAAHEAEAAGWMEKIIEIITAG